MKTAIASLAMLALVGSQTLAAETGLAAGKPAGVEQAQRHNMTRFWVTVGVGVVVAGAIGIALANSDNSGCGTCTVVIPTTGTS